MDRPQQTAPLTFSAPSYALTFLADRPFVYVDDQAGARLLELCVLSSVHPLQGRDDTVRVGVWDVDQRPDETVYSLSVGSSVWDEKIYRFRCQPHRFRYEIEVCGQGHLADVLYFGGYVSAYQRWGSGLLVSGHHFARGFNPEPIAEETHEFDPASTVHIDLAGVPLPGKGDWFFTPPPYCFALQGAHGWVGLGVEAQAGANRWTEYTYHGGRGFHLSLAYEGYTVVDGAYTLPAIGFDFAPDPLAVLRKHVQALRTVGLVPHMDDGPRPAWWYEPIYCGWGTQCYHAAIAGGRAPDYARQSHYAAWLGTLAEHGVEPGIVVIDDKWQRTYGNNEVDADRWPDLPGFVAAQHAAGKKVLLWLKAWDHEGLPPDECILNAGGLPLTADPTNPAYERRLRAAVRRMLSPDGYNADGFKIDFTARIPGGPGMRLYGNLWGLELMKQLLHIIHDEAKRTKADALVITHTPHPYLADVVDMLRLNDTLELERLSDPRIGRNIGATMALRAQIAALACPGVPIDTDNWPVRDRTAWREYMRLQPDLGVPALYFASHIDRTQEPLEAEDYALIRETWARYRAALAADAGTTPSKERR
ncbi:MAG: hypothetical protein M3R24_07035 [Chloroflexota bacterium]|nr:hypothetical protein [Chloroflexota bacterium]